MTCCSLSAVKNEEESLEGLQNKNKEEEEEGE